MNFKITWSAERVSYRMNWLGDKVTMRPYPTEPGHYLAWATSPAAAPMFVPGNDGPFQFQHWVSGTLKRGTSSDFKVFMGNSGSIAGAFS